MAGKTNSREVLAETVKVFVESGGNISETARQLKLKRSTVSERLEAAEKAGLMQPRNATPNPSRWRPADEIIAARKGEFERVKAAGDGRKPCLFTLPDDKPFLIVFIGDPHLDSPGTDLRLFERWTNVLDHRKGVYGFGLGDWLDNWVKPLAFLYGTSETPAPEGWILLEHYLDKIAPHLLGSVAGNHDDWSGTTDLLGHLMKQRGVLHRSKSLRVRLRTPSGRELTIGSRHRFAGNSMWNEVHAIKKAARMGWRDTILVGGDKHVSGESKEKCPDTGRLTWCLQVAAFKVCDDYGDDLGLMDRHVSPAVACVIDPRRSDTDPQLVTPFFEPEEAVKYLADLRRRVARQDTQV